MLIVSPEWIFVKNKRLEKNKSLLLDGPMIVDIIDNECINEKFKQVDRLTYPGHILMPTLSESYIDIDDCKNQVDIDKKINVLLRNGVTRVSFSTSSLENTLSFKIDNSITINYIISFDGKSCRQKDIKDMIKILDYYKSDTTKSFNINLANIIYFDKNILEKISSISNEINCNIHIQGDVLSEIEKIQDIKTTVDFWDSINIINNSYLHDFFYNKDEWLSLFNKKYITLMIAYNEITDLEKLNKILSLIQKKYKCIFVTNKNTSYDFYKVIQTINMINENNSQAFDNSIIDCVTTNTSEIFSKTGQKEIIQKDALATFSLYNYYENSFFNKEYTPRLISNLDKQSLSHVWSAGKQLR